MVMEAKNKTVLVLFSGGLDSTYLVYKNLKEGNRVQPIYIELNNNREKSIIERIQTQKLIDLFDQEFNVDTNRIYNIAKPMQLLVNSSAPELTFRQMPAWITGIMYSNELSEADEVHIGYVMNDSAISYLEDIKRIYYAYQGIVNKKLPRLMFPLIKLDKPMISNMLPERYKELTITCEVPRLALSGSGVKYFDCGDCDPCKRAVKLNLHPDRINDNPDKAPALGINIHTVKLSE